MNLKEAINWLESKQKHAHREDLKKLSQALEKLATPQNNFKVIHITGTNGKGSVASFIYNILNIDYNVGLFVSPYVVKFNERIQINNNYIVDEELLAYIIWAKNFEEEISEHFSFFELLTIIAFKYFSDKKVDYGVIEVGIGGRLDSTNVVNSEISIITSIGIDHINQLGASEKEILKEKLGILKTNKKLITAVKGYDELINSAVKEKNATVEYLNDNEFKIKTLYPLSFEYENELYFSGLQGLFQVKNACLAIKAVKSLNENITYQTIFKGIKKTTNPGRFEVVSENPYVVLDGAHNPKAVEILKVSMQEIFKDKNVVVLYASMKDKNYLEILKNLKEAFSEIIVTTINFPRALNDFSDKFFESFTIIKDLDEALEYATKKLKENDVLLVTGSMYLVSELRNGFLKL